MRPGEEGASLCPVNGARLSKRRRIIEASRGVFAQTGYHGARVEDIARQAGVGKGTVYEYFASKEDLYQEMVLQLTDDYMAELARGLQGGGSPGERLERVAYRHFAFLVRNGELARVAMESPGPVGEKLQMGMERVRIRVEKELTSLFRDGMEEGVFVRLDPLVASRFLLNGLSGVVIHGLMGQETITEESFAAAFGLLARGLFSRSEGESDPRGES